MGGSGFIAIEENEERGAKFDGGEGEGFTGELLARFGLCGNR